MNNFFSIEELSRLGLKSYGKNILISKDAKIYSPEMIEIGDNVRIDDFCIISGKIKIGSFVHISAHTSLFSGNAGIEIGDYVSVSSRCAVYAISDDYSGQAMANPMVPIQYRNPIEKKVIIGKHALIGSGCTILPGVKLCEGVSVGSMSLINKSLEPWGIYVGIPCKKIKERSKKILDFEKELLNCDKD